MLLTESEIIKKIIGIFHANTEGFDTYQFYFVFGARYLKGELKQGPIEDVEN